MSIISEHIEILVAAKLSGNINTEENAVLQSWLDESPENQAFFASQEKLWRLSSPGFSHKTDRAWNKVKLKMNHRPSQQGIVRRFRLPLAVGIAASLLILFTTWWMNMQVETPGTQNGIFAFRSGASPENVELPDGTVLELAPKSEVRYFEHEKQRVVNFVGEAVFKVKRNEALPFHIYTDYSHVTVLGTSFLLRADDHDTATFISVIEGKVSFSDIADSSELILIANESAQVGHIDHAVNRFNADGSLDRKTLIFKNTSLEIVAKALSSRYQKQVQLRNDSIGQCLFSSTFEDESIDEVLTIICESMSLDYNAEGDVYWIEGNQCH